MNANGHGGKRRGAGRPKGSRNRATLAREAGLPDAVEAARAHAAQAFEVLAGVMGDTEAPASARVKAAGMLLDRAYGRAVPIGPVRRVTTQAEREERERERLADAVAQHHGRDVFGLSAADEAKARALGLWPGSG